MMYSESDVERWKSGTPSLIRGYSRRVERHQRGDRLPRQLAAFYENEALIAIAEGDGSKALAYVRESVNNDMLLWDDCLCGYSQPNAIESIRQVAFGPIISAFVISPSFVAKVATKFAAVARKLNFDGEIAKFGAFLGQLPSNVVNPFEKSPACQIEIETLTLANAFNTHDEATFTDAVISGSDDWIAYIRTDQGWPNSVCFLPGVAFVRLAQSTWAPRLKVDHSMIPSSVLDCAIEPDYSVPIRIPNR